MLLVQGGVGRSTVFGGRPADIFWCVRCGTWRVLLSDLSTSTNGLTRVSGGSPYRQYTHFKHARSPSHVCLRLLVLAVGCWRQLPAVGCWHQLLAYCLWWRCATSSPVGVVLVMRYRQLSWRILVGMRL